MFSCTLFGGCNDGFAIDLRKKNFPRDERRWSENEIKGEQEWDGVRIEMDDGDDDLRFYSILLENFECSHGTSDGMDGMEAVSALYRRSLASMITAEPSIRIGRAKGWRELVPRDTPPTIHGDDEPDG